MMEARLVKYAYYVGKLGGEKDEWKVIDSQSPADLNISLSENHHLIVWKAGKIMENLSLWNSDSWMKAIAKGDSMLFVSKFQGSHRRFRVKFADRERQSGSGVRRVWTERLRRYFSLTEMDTPTDTQQSSTDKQSPPNSNEDQICGEAVAGTLAKVLSGDLKHSLPAVYHQTAFPTSAQSLNTAVALCLSDANFPAFVHQVAKQMDKLLEKPS